MTYKPTPQERQEASDDLRALFPRGSRVTTVVRHVTPSGMSRSIQVLAVTEHGIADVSYLVQRATYLRLDTRHPGLKINGAGMDVAFALVYTLSRTIYGDGYALTKVSL